MLDIVYRYSFFVFKKTLRRIVFVFFILHHTREKIPNLFLSFRAPHQRNEPTGIACPNARRSSPVLKETLWKCEGPKIMSIFFI